MREHLPEQLSIFDLLDGVEKPESFFMADSYSGSVRGTDSIVPAFEKIRYIGNRDLPDNVFTVYVRRCTGTKGGHDRYIVSVPTIGFDFGYNSLERLLSEWEIPAEKLDFSGENIH